MKASAFECDSRGCGQKETTSASFCLPAGWISMYGPLENGSVASWQFCSWPCVRGAVLLANRAGIPTFASRAAELSS